MIKIKQQRRRRDRSPFFHEKGNRETDFFRRICRSSIILGIHAIQAFEGFDIFVSPPRNSSILFFMEVPRQWRNSVLVEAECVEENDLCQDIKRTLKYPGPYFYAGDSTRFIGQSFQQKVLRDFVVFLLPENNFVLLLGSRF
ncbi:hypothetical protein CEXT_348421 [Caerostris extrusa]|uniref:Uncharacterized protein n=1 Tax=Caerostris extrusa TaxID=172846 RepID=A0AAV4TXA8_CAEEX|nr:hypothetical protein CEXT_348421 [Caerostris extrusa]